LTFKCFGGLANLGGFYLGLWLRRIIKSLIANLVVAWR
jgi:hypothetical protein